MFQKVQTTEKVFLIAFEQLRMLVIEKKQHEIEMQYKEILRPFAGDLDKASNELSKEFTRYLAEVGKYYQSLRSDGTSSSLTIL